MSDLDPTDHPDPPLWVSILVTAIFWGIVLLFGVLLWTGRVSGVAL